MYKLSVPFMLEQIELYGANQFIHKLKEIGADIVFLALDCYQIDQAKQKKVFSELSKNVPIFKNAGFTVGVWIWSFMFKEKNDFVHITGVNGKADSMQVCPSDQDFCKFSYEYIQNIAKSDPDIILFDDDFRYGFLECGLGCTCKNHRMFMEGILDEKLPDGDLSHLIFTGGKNKYRSAFLKANGEYLKAFAKQSRDAVDSINPNIRLGLCSCMSTWDFDGVSAAELSRILAGNTKPFCRLSGAPYWSNKRSWGNRLQDVIELERMESSWCGCDIEIFSEGDTYPRPRFVCPANVLEGFDMALRASGATNGIHKYTLDYYADVEYEQGYNKKHLQNQNIYKQIDKHFENKIPTGIRVYEHMTKFENMDIPDYYQGSDNIINIFFSPAARMLATHAIPSVYEGKGVVGIAFGENAKYLDEEALNHGLILDISAAQILEEKGIDVGLAKKGDTYSIVREYFVKEKRNVLSYRHFSSDIQTKDNAEIQSFFTDDSKKTIGSYSYTNADGQHFLVFAFDGYRMSEHAFKQYARGRQIVDWITSIGKKLPASMLGNPDCYLLCKENENSKAIWIGNFFADECMNTTVMLDKEYKEIEFINGSGKLNGNKVELDYIAPFASLGFEVK